MKKVININFQGQVIAIEEDAYEILKQYIESLQDYFSHEEGGDEIVNDIESRIAELFGNRLKHGISCITDEDVEAIIESIGRPRDFDVDYEETRTAEPDASFNDHKARAGSTGSQAHSAEEPRRLYRNSGDQTIGGVCSGIAHYLKIDPVWVRIIFVLLFGLLFWVYIILWIVLKSRHLESNVTKRFYRNPGDRVLGGVCGGLAAYFKIDSWIPRVLFLLPLILNLIGMVSIFPLSRIFDHFDFNWNINGSMAVVYLVLWIIIPEAKTVKQKLEMMGEEEYIRSIREKVNDNAPGTKNRTNSNQPLHDTPPAPPAGTSYSAKTSSNAFSRAPEQSGCLNGLVVLLKIIFFTLVGIFALVLLSVFVGFLFTGTQLWPLKSLFIDSGYETHLLIISSCLLILVPVVSITAWIIRRLMKAKSRPVIGIIAAVLWIGGLATTGLLATRIVNKYNVESSSETTVNVAPVTATKMYVEMLPYHDDYSEFKVIYSRRSPFDNLPYCTINEDSLLYSNINLQVRNSTDSLFHVRAIAASRGRNLRSAKDDIMQFSYPIFQNDSVLFLPEFLTVPIEQGFRNQSITVEISVPAGKSVEISDALSDYKNSEPPAVVRKRIRNFSRTYMPGDSNLTPKPQITLTTDTI
ncbi:MAG: PspC domain-containing protein [Bacteroidales bacterium]|nr:PspC domain-containing protein [Bacteroidales bacterium]